MAAIGEPDETLMARTADGDRACLELLVRRHATPLLTFLARMAGDRHRGEELFQEVFLAVWVKRRQYQHNLPENHYPGGTDHPVRLEHAGGRRIAPRGKSSALPLGAFVVDPERPPMHWSGHFQDDIP